MNLLFLGDKIIFLQRDRSHKKSTSHCLAARSNVIIISLTETSRSTASCQSSLHDFSVQWRLFGASFPGPQEEGRSGAPCPSSLSLVPSSLQGGCYHPRYIYISMDGAWTWDRHCCHSPAGLGEGDEEVGAIPPFLPSPWHCLVSKSIEPSVTSRPSRVCSAASLPKLNIPAPHAAWDRQERGLCKE